MVPPRDGLSSTAWAIPRANVLRDDEPAPSLKHDAALASAHEVESGRFKVTRIAETGA